MIYTILCNYSAGTAPRSDRGGTEQLQIYNDRR